MSQKILGRAKIRVNDQFFDSEQGATLVPGGFRNNARPTSHSFKYNQSFIPSRVTCSIPFQAGQSLKELQSLADVEIHFEADTGQTYVIRNAAQTGEVSVADGEQGGMIALEFQGNPADELIGGA